MGRDDLGWIFVGQDRIIGEEGAGEGAKEEDQKGRETDFFIVSVDHDFLK
jgi:hypothetical protein